MFRYIVEKVKEATHGWSKKYLSHGGKEILIKAVALAMSIYSMNDFRLPKEICDEINGILAKFWWSSGEKKRIHWYAWKRVGVPKKEGGLRFKDLEKFNQALLAKQVWRIMQNSNCLMSRIIKARYFATGNILTAVQRRKTSYAWKSLIYGRDLLTKGLRFIIGNGNSVDMWNHAWLPVHPPRPPRSLNIMDPAEKVHSYIHENGTGWNREKLREYVHEEDLEEILKIKISATAEADLLGWHYNEDGIYTVKSGYWLNTHLPDNEIIIPVYGEQRVKQRIWKCSTPPKIKHFMWKTVSHSLATNSNLRRRHITNNGECLRCCSAEETEQHLFF